MHFISKSTLAVDSSYLLVTLCYFTSIRLVDSVTAACVQQKVNLLVFKLWLFTVLVQLSAMRSLCYSQQKVNAILLANTSIWILIHLQLEYFEWIRKDLNIQKLEDFYKVTKNQITERGGASLLVLHHSLINALKSVYPGKYPNNSEILLPTGLFCEISEWYPLNFYWLLFDRRYLSTWGIFRNFFTYVNIW